jgi:hypothetical protein
MYLVHWQPYLDIIEPIEVVGALGFKLRGKDKEY